MVYIYRITIRACWFFSVNVISTFWIALIKSFLMLTEYKRVFIYLFPFLTNGNLYYIYIYVLQKFFRISTYCYNIINISIKQYKIFDN